MFLRDKYAGTLIGLACGDALGAPIEFMRLGTFNKVTEMMAGGPFNLPAGYWTDDTSLALCLAQSIIARKGFDPVDQLRNYLRWYESGYMSSNGKCFDIGNTTREALERFRAETLPYPGPTESNRAGNGSLMRLCPVPMAFLQQPEVAIRLSGESSRTTHDSVECIDACKYLGALLVGALSGEEKQNLLSPQYEPVPGLWKKNPLTAKIAKVANGSFRDGNHSIRGTTYVVDCLEAALWAFDNSNTFEEGCIKAVNLGEDADTTGAVYGQLAGAFYGLKSIPVRWIDKVTKLSKLKGIANRLDKLRL